MKGKPRPFAHLEAEKAGTYRAIMRVFVEAKARFAIHLRSLDVLETLDPAHAPDELEAALKQLCVWGNLEDHPDTADATTVEEFYHPPSLFQMTLEGEAAERALEVYDQALLERGELQAAALDDILVELRELHELARRPELDEAKVHRALRALFVRFDELTRRARVFIGSLQRTIDLHEAAMNEFLAYKERLVDYLERFVGGLVVTAAAITRVLHDLERAGMERLLDAAAGRDLSDAVSPTEEDRQAARVLWGTKWAGLRSWFIGDGTRPTPAEELRQRARNAIPALLNVVESINERRSTRSDRAADLRTLARWFAETDSDDEAHRLWRAAFGLSPARHLPITHESLASFDGTSPKTSWLDGPRLALSPRLRKTGRTARRGRPSSVIDRSAEKEQLAAIADEEARQLEKAMNMLASVKHVRLSELAELDIHEFGLLLDLIGQALSQSPEHVGPTCSSDGSLSIELEEIPGAPLALVRTRLGTFQGPDHFLTIQRAHGP